MKNKKNHRSLKAVNTQKCVISGYVGKRITGIGRNLIELLEHAKSGRQYVVYCNKDALEDFNFRNSNVTVKTYGVSKNSSIGNLLWTTFVFPFIVKKEKADFALIPNFTLLLFKFVPTAVMLYDLIEFNVPDKFSKLRMFYRIRIADPLMVSRSDHIVTTSDNSKRDIVKYLKAGPDKISMVYCGVDRAKFKQTDKEEAYRILQAKQISGHFILFVGTIDYPGKNVMSVIRVYEKLREKGHYNGRLVLAGMPGASFQVIDDYVKKSPYREDILLAGYVTDEELVALYNTCDLFCFLSFYEGFGLPPLEAMSCGAKVLVSNVSSLPEVAGDIAWQADPHNLREIYEQAKKALSARTDASYEQNKDVHLRRFDWDALGLQFEEAIAKCMVKQK